MRDAEGGANEKESTGAAQESPAESITAVTEEGAGTGSAAREADAVPVEPPAMESAPLAAEQPAPLAADTEAGAGHHSGDSSDDNLADVEVPDDGGVSEVDEDWGAWD